MKYFFNKNRLIKYSIEDITSNKLIIHHHLGLGDYINCNGMVNYLSNMFDKIIIPLKSNYAHMIKYLYKDNPKIEFLNLENKLKSNIKKLTIEDFNLNSVTFSGPEMKFLKKWIVGDFAEESSWEDYIIDGYYGELMNLKKNKETISLEDAEKLLREEYGFSKRELKEFKSKISKE